MNTTNSNNSNTYDNISEAEKLKLRRERFNNSITGVNTLDAAKVK
jgi:hypothetical protein